MKNLIFLFVLYLSPLYSFNMEVKADSAILINAETKSILFEKNSHKKLHPASVTKIATATYIIDCKRLDMNSCVVVPGSVIGTLSEKRKRDQKQPSYVLESDGRHMDLKKGEEIKVIDLLNGLLITSANDAANVLSFEASSKKANKSIPLFMQELNTYLQTIGCKDTQFLNPHGLYDENHYTTAYDLSLIMAKGIQNPSFKEIVEKKVFICPPTNFHEERSFPQTNRLMRPGKWFYPYAIGGKTGYTRVSQNNYIVAASKEGRTLIAVLLKTEKRENMFEDAISLFKKAFAEPKIKKTLFKSGKLDLNLPPDEKRPSFSTYLKEDIEITYYPSERGTYRVKIEWLDLPLPIEKGSVVGILKVIGKFSEGKETLLTEAPLFSLEEVKTKGFPEKYIKIAGLFILVFAALFLWKTFKKR